MRPILEDLAAEREAFIDNPGTDADYDGIRDEIGHDEDEDERSLNARWFDLVMTRFRELSGAGEMTVHRRISVKDPEAFVSPIGSRPLGCSWSWDEESASCDYHLEANHEHEILLTAQAPETSVCWQDSMVQHFGHPHEREIVIEGNVRNLVITLEGRVLAQCRKRRHDGRCEGKGMSDEESYARCADLFGTMHECLPFAHHART